MLDKLNMDLAADIDHLPSTSIITLRKLRSLGINTFFDLLNYFPFRYENYSLTSQISKIQEGEVVSVKGVIRQVKNIFTRKGAKIQKLRLADQTAETDLIWYNQPFLLRILKVNDYLSVSGLVKRFGSDLSIEPQEYEIITRLEAETIHTGRIVPIYPEKKGISAKTIRSKLFYLVKNLPSLAEFLPTEIISYNDLISRQEAYKNIHFPDTLRLSVLARQRLAFEELFLIQLSASYVRREWEKKKVVHVFRFDEEISRKIETFISGLPFNLTEAQKKATREITDDLKMAKPMNRFLQGEVGSGKTVVAAVASYLTYLNGFQTLFMAPTEILAQQHYQTVKTISLTAGVKSGGMKICLLTSSAKPEKEELKKADIIIGTQALLNKKLELKRVGLVVVDEQHRFGVKQRALLKGKAINPHLLTMTATPIPRTVLLTLHGELDLSLIDEMPVGRIPVKTFLVPPEKRAPGYTWIREQIRKLGSQVFLICPLIEESKVETRLSLKAAKKEYDRLKKEIFPDLAVGLLHGKLKSREKEQIMQDFKQKKYDILVSTSVVEVGIDVPNATIIIIEGADRFGLAQLHQLRGRVGRSDKQSFCLLFTDATDEGSLKRLQFFSQTQSGRQLAEYDLKTRGPGDIYGTKQHGYLNLKVASLSDIDLINKSKKAANYFRSRYSDLEKFPEVRERLGELRVKQVSRD